jgi:hypothetical protein
MPNLLQCIRRYHHERGTKGLIRRFSAFIKNTLLDRWWDFRKWIAVNIQSKFSNRSESEILFRTMPAYKLSG